MNAGPDRLLVTAIRVLNASSVNRVTPKAEDVSFLRKITGDARTPIDELACDIIKRALRKTSLAKTMGTVLNRQILSLSRYVFWCQATKQLASIRQWEAGY